MQDLTKAIDRNEEKVLKIIKNIRDKGGFIEMKLKKEN